MEFILPILVLLGLGALVFGGDDDADTTAGGTAGSSDSADDMDDAPRNFQIFDDLDNATIGTDASDSFQMGAGDDTATGGAGDDRLFLGAGNDESIADDLAEAEGDDLIRGGDGDDVITDTAGANRLFGDTGADTIDASDDPAEADAPDEVNGGFGADTLIVDDGDSVTGGAGLDMFRIAYATSDAPVVITDYEANEPIKIDVPEDLAGQTPTLEAAENGTDSNIVIGDQTVAVLQGVTDLSTVNLDVAGTNVLGASDSAGQTFTGTEGDDVIITGGGDNVVNAGAGDDVVTSRTGADVIDAGPGDDIVRAGAGGDVVNAGAGVDTVYAGFGQDVVTTTDEAGTDAADRVFAGARDDTVNADDGDVINLGAGSDTLNVAPEVGDDVVTVRDFNPPEDTVEITAAAGVAGVVGFAPDTAGTGTVITLDGEAVVALNGVLPAALQTGNVTIVPTPVVAA